eukprot:14663432-Alexandrium_andersonii.AAC.1
MLAQLNQIENAVHAGGQPTPCAGLSWERSEVWCAGEHGEVCCARSARHDILRACSARAPPPPRVP